MRKTNKNLKKFWLITLMDLMLLMLTFFIMLYSMTSPKDTPAQEEHILAPLINLKRGVHLNYLKQILSQRISSFDGYKMIKNKKNLTLQIPSLIFSDAKQKTLSTLDEIRISALGEILSNISNEIVLQIKAENLNTTEALLLAMKIANQLKEGGYTAHFPVRRNLNAQSDFIELVIFEHLGESR